MAANLKRLAVILISTGLLGITLLYLYTLPALRRLPKAKSCSRHGINTIDDAVRALRDSGKTDWALVSAAQQLVNAKMAYSRRNGWDTPARAFRRGMGYCQQQALALLLILRKLGIEARPVQALRCQFPPKQIHEYEDPGGISGHVWLVVTIAGVEKDVCPGHPENEPGKVHFTPLSRRTNYGPCMQIFGHIGSMILNVQRDRAALKKATINKTHHW